MGLTNNRIQNTKKEFPIFQLIFTDGSGLFAEGHL